VQESVPSVEDVGGNQRMVKKRLLKTTIDQCMIQKGEMAMYGKCRTLLLVSLEKSKCWKACLEKHNKAVLIFLQES